MTRSLSAAISGIDANQAMLDNIGNNIANVNTVGYQSTELQFSDLLYQQQAAAGAPQIGVAGGTNPVEIGSGVRVAATTTNFSQGTLSQTGVQTDLAIQGQGFLAVNQGGTTYYTRAGNLQLDGAGQLVTPSGAIVQGWLPGANGAITTSGPLSDIVIPQGQAANPQATQNITLGGNLPAWNGSGTAPSYNVTETAYDSLGNPIPITLTFTASTTANQWNVNASVTNPKTGAQEWLPSGSTTAPTTSLTTVTFDPTTGQVSGVGSSTTGPFQFALTGLNTIYPNAASTVNVDFPASGSTGAVTQFAGTSSVQATSQDGSSSGALDGYTIGANGVISGQYANGDTQPLGQIALATFANPEGLSKQGNLLYASSNNSGNAQLGAPGAGGRGTLIGGSVETSNVNLGTELTNLIVAQTAYQANTKVVSTTSTVLQALVQM
ncbi:MAG: flagellar hook protein FlgE [Acidimicrobiales bacterium]